MAKEDFIIKNTTCFAEHKKNAAECNNTECKYWIKNAEKSNCVLIMAEDGPKTLQEIGDLFGVTRMRICQIEKLIFRKLSNKANLSQVK
jgi:DNA-directed RNA polymerase specialized sigma subunit